MISGGVSCGGRLGTSPSRAQRQIWQCRNELGSRGPGQEGGLSVRLLMAGQIQRSPRICS